MSLTQPKIYLSKLIKKEKQRARATQEKRYGELSRRTCSADYETLLKSPLMIFHYAVCNFFASFALNLFNWKRTN